MAADKNEAIEQEKEQLRADLDALRADFRSLLQTLQSEGVAAGHRAADRVAGAYGTAREKSAQQVDNFQEVIESRPLASMGVAFLVGLVVGKLLDVRS
jgi:ElaB/YqjD/DUF883 family membrane-anchored ribosome-binding protein